MTPVCAFCGEFLNLDRQPLGSYFNTIRQIGKLFRSFAGIITAHNIHPSFYLSIQLFPMSKIIPFEDKDLGIIYFEVAEAPENVATRSGGLEQLSSRSPVSERVVASLDNALDSVGKLVGKIANAIVNNPMYPDEIECKVGIKFTAAGGIVVANAGAEGSLELTLKWNSKQLADRGKTA